MPLASQVIEIIRNRFFLENTLVHHNITALVRDIAILMTQLQAAATLAPKGIKPRLADLVVRPLLFVQRWLVVVLCPAPPSLSLLL